MYVVSISDHVHIINSHLAEWLFNASVEEAPNPYSRGIFKKESQALVTEPDGSVHYLILVCLPIHQVFITV